jgi:Skp family chaperone for outer membrane proteins
MSYSRTPPRRRIILGRSYRSLALLAVGSLFFATLCCCFCSDNVDAAKPTPFAVVQSSSTTPTHNRILGGETLVTAERRQSSCKALHVVSEVARGGGGKSAREEEESEDEYCDDEYDEEQEETTTNDDESDESLSSPPHPTSTISTGVTAFVDTLTILIKKALSLFFPMSDNDVNVGGDDISRAPTQAQATMAPSSLSSNTILKGSFQNALHLSRSCAKLLVVYIPTGSKKGKAYDNQCLASLSNSEVLNVADKYKKGSFLIWDGSDSSSAENARTRKRLKVKANSKGGAVPTLAVVYAAQMVDAARGKVVVVPKILAQHHCQPPPTPAAMAAWLKSLRQRHAKLVAKMRHMLQEQDFFVERQKGYKESLQSDVKRETQERLDQQKKDEQEKVEQERLVQREQTRKTLLEALPAEPEAGSSSDIITVGLRFPDGRSAKRRFSHGDGMKHVFHWIDGEYDIESEQISLTTMNGSSTFVYDGGEEGGDSIGDVIGTSKMVALRVMTTNKEAVAGDNKNSKEEETSINANA